MISRTLDPTFLLDVANHPEVRPWLGSGSLAHFEAAIRHPANVAITTEHGGWLLQQLQLGVYEIHSLFLPEGRGEHFFTAAKEMLRYMFTRTNCLEILTKCPDTNGAARMASAKNGFRERFRREAAWEVGTPEECGVSYQYLTVDGWMIRDPEALKAGRMFHDVIERAKLMTGSSLPVHPDDETHDRAAGAAWLIANAGQSEKAAEVYTRWAVFAGYQPIVMLSHGVFDIGDAVIEILDGETRVLLVR